jgi:hypothetical protein
MSKKLSKLTVIIGDSSSLYFGRDSYRTVVIELNEEQQALLELKLTGTNCDRVGTADKCVQYEFVSKCILE